MSHVLRSLQSWVSTIHTVVLTAQYIGEMETRFNKGDWDGFRQFRGQRRPSGIFHGGTFWPPSKCGQLGVRSILFLNRIGPSQDISHSPQKIQEVVPGFRSWKLSPPKFAMIWRGVRCRREYHQNDRLERRSKGFHRERSDVFALEIAKNHLSLLY